MPWTPPADPVAGTVITVAWAVANVTNLLRHLRIMTGNADPPGSDYVPVSTSTAATAWAKITADAMASGAVVGNLGYTPANKAGEAFTGAVSATSLAAPSGSISAGVNISAPSGNITAGGALSAGGTISTTSISANSIVTQGGISANGAIAAGGGISAPSYGDVHAGFVTATGPITTTDSSANAIATTGGASIGGNLGVTGSIFTTAGTVQASRLTATVAGGTAPLVVTSTTLVNNLNAQLHNGAPADTLAGAGRIPIADASGKLDTWVTASVVGATVPSGLIALWDGTPTVAPPSGWVYFSGADGRFVIGATTGFALGATGGFANYDHSVNIAHGHADSIGASLSGSITANTSVTSELNVATPGQQPATGNHSHAHSFTVTKSGGVTNLGSTSVATGAISHLPPYVALNHIRKS